MVLGVANADEADRIFAGLGDGSEAILMLQATHWSPSYGSSSDAAPAVVRDRMTYEKGLSVLHAIASRSEV